MNLINYLDRERKTVDRQLSQYLKEVDNFSGELVQAMRYSVFAGGKRLRPVLMLAIAEMFDKPAKQVLQAACAVEYMHTSTLILDDLPCMDDSDLRRGRASLHKKFGQSTAILASYALVALAFDLLMKNAERVSDDSRLALNVTESMSRAMGHKGICAGQYVDLKSGAKKIDFKTLTYLHEHKTADLFVASCRIAGYLCNANAAQLKALSDYGKNMGLAFQIFDDMLSLSKTDSELGKQTKKDKDSPNAVNLFGIERAKALLKKYSQKSNASLRIFAGKAGILRDFLGVLRI